ncbi:MAG TPA: hypothetical protein VKW04_14125 [Planctomycetota bacterium]|nr:hypothetical protein [Planctomycetota bacterium]
MLQPGGRSILRWTLDAIGDGASRLSLLVVWVLGRIFARPDEPEWLMPLNRPSRSIRYLKHLGRLRRREGTIACDLGSLAKVVHRQGLDQDARRFAKGAFDRWRKSRRYDRRLRQRVERALREHAL